MTEPTCDVGRPPASDPETKYPVLVVCALIENDGKVLVEQRAPTGVAGLDRMFDLPGGKVENGENPAEAIVREIREELGILIHPVELLPELYKSAWDYGKGIRHWILAVYRCQIVSGSSDKLLWKNTADLNEGNTLAADLSVIRRYTRQKEGVHTELPTDSKLAEFLESAKNHVMTPEEKEAQRQSWVRGEMGIGDDRVEAEDRKRMAVLAAQSACACPSCGSQARNKRRIGKWSWGALCLNKWHDAPAEAGKEGE